VPAGDALCFVLAARDVTDRLKAEAEQRKLEEQLRQAQKMEAVGRLAGGVAHDFNNLLTVITGYGQMLIEENVGTEEQRENLRAIVDAAHQASSLTGQLLAFSRKQVLRPVALDLNALVLDADRMLKRLIPEDIEVVTNLAPGLPCIRADAGQVQQVLLNLALNARDAMPSGGRLTFATSLLRSVPAGSPWPADSPAANGLVRLAVSDNGAGIAPDTLAHVFEPFFTTKERGKGTGLGLSTVYGIVTQSGGTIGVQSEPGRGTTFEILLPAAGEPRAVMAAHPAQAIGGTETVLVVEDQSDVRRMVALVLERLGYHVLQAASGEEALRLLTSHQEPLDLLVTDVVMPGMTGDHLARLLRLARPGLPVLFMSGYADRLVMERELATTQASFLQKPFSPAVLAARVRAVLDAPASS
jgi:nitrogen-specific signal transduction histidine kinase